MNEPNHSSKPVTDESTGLTLQQLCDQCSNALKMDGASLTLTTTHNDSAAYASSDVFAVIADIQFTLGEGPEIDALKTREVVVAPDIALMSQRWPTFSQAAYEHNVGRVIALPLRIGAITLGVLTAYDHIAKTFSDTDIRHALTVAKSATWLLVTLHGNLAIRPPPLVSADPFSYRAVVHQATGMIADQLQCGMADALVRLRAHAYAQQQSITDVAQAIVRRELKLQS